MHKIVETGEAVILEPNNATAAVIWLHGLGADGHDFVPIVEELEFPSKAQTRFFFPHAPIRPVTIYGGQAMRAWYDIVDIAAGAPVDEAGILGSAKLVRMCIATQLRTRVAHERIVLAGFSQGGAIVLHTVLRYTLPMAGIMALSTYLPISSTLPGEPTIESQNIPIFMAHGRYDDIVPLQLAEAARTALNHWQYKVEWHTYPMPHSVCAEEVTDISHWLSQVLP